MAALVIFCLGSMRVEIVAIEREFKVKFTTAEVGSLKNAGELKALVLKKLGGAG